MDSDNAARKNTPLASGVLDYFPDALAEVAQVSRVGNEQHNPGQPLHWARGKSSQHADSLLRHLIDRGGRDEDGVRHSAKVAWRALALLQEEAEASLPRGARLPEAGSGADDEPGYAVAPPSRDLQSLSLKALGYRAIPETIKGCATNWGNAFLKHLRVNDGDFIPDAMVYVAGPMRSKPGFGFGDFDRAERLLNAHGIDTISPARLDVADYLNTIAPEAPSLVNGAYRGDAEPWITRGDVVHYLQSLNSSSFVQRDITAILALTGTRRAIVVLPGWERSQGTLAEIMVGFWLGIPVLALDMEQATLTEIANPIESE